MKPLHPKPTGLTKDSDYQMGIRRTYPISKEKIWDFLCSETGLKIWLGDLETGEFALQKNYQTKEGITGKITVIQPFSHLRLTWKIKDWENISRLQIRTIPAKTGTTISFHQEKLLDLAQREQMLQHWEAVLAVLGEKISSA